MRRHRSFLVTFGLLVFGACSNGGPQSLGPVPTADTTTTTSTVPVTTTAAPATTTTAATATTVRATTSTTAGPRLVNGIPQVTATPARAPVGARVRLDGTGFTDSMWRTGDSPLWLVGAGGCNFYAPATHTITVSAAGRLTGEFTVPDTGGCRMSDLTRPMTSGTYRIAFVATPAFIGQIEVTTTAGPCVQVGFAPNSDNVAGNIIARGMDCIEAEALVRKAGAQVHAVGGPARVEVDGFVCVRTAQYDGRGLPSADYECTSGSKTVTFNRS